MKKVLILGGYGNFGWRIAKALSLADIPIVIAGRNAQKAEALKDQLRSYSRQVETAIFDVTTELDAQLKVIKPHVVINTCGPYQLTDYHVAESCIAVGAHYIDLSDGRDFVAGISALEKQAKQKDVLVVSGASTVPGLSSAVLDVYAKEFSEIDSMVFGIAPGQKADRGLATTQAILTYVGQRLKPCAGYEVRYGWQDLYRQDYPELGKRWMANCEVPDLDLLPETYRIKSIRFSAGMESSLLHLGIWFLSWCVRIGVPLNLPRHAKFLWRASYLFDWMGSSDGGMHILLEGRDLHGQPHKRSWFIVAKDGDGPSIPTIPAIILARKLVRDEIDLRGAVPCVGLVSLDEYLEELKSLKIKVYVT